MNSLQQKEKDLLSPPTNPTMSPHPQVQFGLYPPGIFSASQNTNGIPLFTFFYILPFFT